MSIILKNLRYLNGCALFFSPQGSSSALQQQNACARTWGSFSPYWWGWVSFLWMRTVFSRTWSCAVPFGPGWSLFSWPANVFYPLAYAPPFLCIKKQLAVYRFSSFWTHLNTVFPFRSSYFPVLSHRKHRITTPWPARAANEYSQENPYARELFGKKASLGES